MNFLVQGDKAHESMAIWNKVIRDFASFLNENPVLGVRGRVIDDSVVFSMRNGDEADTPLSLSHKEGHDD